MGKKQREQDPSKKLFVDTNVYQRIRSAVKANDDHRAIEILMRAGDITRAKAKLILEDHRKLLKV